MKLPLIALCLLSFILINAVEATNYKKKYCGNEEFVPGVKYPHLHCGKDFFTLSYSGGNKHVNFVDGNGAQCKKIDKVLDSPSEYGIDEIDEIKDAINNFKKHECDDISVECNKNRNLFVEEYPVIEENSNSKYYHDDEEYRKPYKNRKEYMYSQEDDEELEYEVERRPYWRMRREYRNRRF